VHEETEQHTFPVRIHTLVSAKMVADFLYSEIIFPLFDEGFSGNVIVMQGEAPTSE
jgi:hypothetical protein